MRFGLATSDITPPFKTPMGGYGARRDDFDGSNDPLLFQTVVLEEGGRRAVIGVADLHTLPNDGTTPKWMDRVAEIAGCPRENVFLCATHTHGGPQMPGRSAYYRRCVGSRPGIVQYRDWLGERIAATVREALDKMMEGTLWLGEGKTRFPLNRRPMVNGRVQNAPNPTGPIDDRMQLFIFRDAAGKIISVGMRLSCHPVATGAQHRLTADFPGAWRTAFTRAFGPDVMPFFLQGSGADARPRHVAEGDHWRALKHADLPILGQDLLEESLAILASNRLRPIEALLLRGRITEVEAPCEKHFTRAEQFEPFLRSDDGCAQVISPLVGAHMLSYQRIFAEDCMDRLRRGEPIPDHTMLHVQSLWLNNELCLIGLDGEPLAKLGGFVESAVRPRQGIVIGYTGGCDCYLPDTEEMKRGGYEAESYIFEPWTGPLCAGLETLLGNAVMKQP